MKRAGTSHEYDDSSNFGVSFGQAPLAWLGTFVGDTRTGNDREKERSPGWTEPTVMRWFVFGLDQGYKRSMTGREGRSSASTKDCVGEP